MLRSAFSSLAVRSYVVQTWRFLQRRSQICFSPIADYGSNLCDCYIHGAFCFSLVSEAVRVCFSLRYSNLHFLTRRQRYIRVVTYWFNWEEKEEARLLLIATSFWRLLLECISFLHGPWNSPLRKRLLPLHYPFRELRWARRRTGRAGFHVVMPVFRPLAHASETTYFSHYRVSVIISQCYSHLLSRW